MNKMFRICVNFLIIAFSISQITTINAKISNRVILGTTQKFLLALKDNEQHDNHTKVLISSIVDSNRSLNHMYTVIHYETGLSSKANITVGNFIRLVTETNQKPRILLTIRISNPNNLPETPSGDYLDILNDLKQSTIPLEGISIEMTTVEENCDSGLPDMKTLPGKIKTALKKFQRLRTAKVGYVLNYNSINCTFHGDSIRAADFIILKISLQRTDIIFVESYGAFKVHIENLIKSAESVLKQFNKTNNYYQFDIKSDIIFNKHPFKINANGTKAVALSKDYTELINIENGLKDLNILIGRAYQQLLTQYCHRWLSHDQAGINTIISYKYGLQNTDPPHWDRDAVIPYLITLPLKSTIKKLQSMESASFLLQDVRDSGFNTIMINGDIWRALSKDREDYVKPCLQTKCLPENVMYFNNQNNAFSNQNKPEIQKLANIEEMQLTTLVFSTYYSESKTKWSDIVKYFKEKGKLTMNRQRTCTEQSDFFRNVRAQSKCDNTCHALDFKNLNGCGSLQQDSENIMWRGIIHIQEYTVSYFVENIISRLDSLVIARQIMRKKFDNPTLPVFLRIRFNHTKFPVLNENKFPLYCNPFYDQVYQYYEMILTWAKIHAFPIIIEPTINAYNFINPISWQPLITSRSDIIRGLMKSSPLFIRRSYNLSMVFGQQWTAGMYPCLQQAEDLGSLHNFNLNHDFAGITINIDIRTKDISLKSNELKVMLLYSLGKFNAVEIILQTDNHVKILFNVLSEPHFDMILKQNSIYRGKIYLQVSSLQHEPIHAVILKLQQFGFQVHITTKTAQDFDHLMGIDSIVLGTVQETCTTLAHKILYDKNSSSLEIFSKNVSYLICETLPIPAKNSEKKIMHEYLETHLYLRKLFQYLYPNLKKVHFRLHPFTSDKTTNISEIEMLFLADVNNFAQGHQVHYFMLPVLPHENTTDSSFWKVKSYQDLSDPSVYEDKLAAVLNLTAWKPIPTWHASTTPNFVNSSGNMGPSENQRKGPSQLIIYISVGAASIASFVVTVLVIVKARRSNNFLSEKEVKDFFYGKMETLEKAINERKITTKKSRNVYDGLVYQKDCEISKNDIKVDRKSCICTSNKFFNKFRAKLQNGRDGNVLVEVSSKKCSRDKFKAWLSEVKMLCYVGSHNNIVGFMGSYTSEIPKGVLWVVTEFCEEGSLENHLKSFKDTLNVDELIRFACEIAIGMEYISSQNVIHGDLRSRHVYLDQHKVCKVGDFGLSRKLLQYKASVKKGKRERLPWRWMPCEALQNLEFSVYSDVWSYGVTLWEIFSLGELPYGEDEIFSQTFVAQVMKGKRLLCPSQATPEIFEKMQECWTLDPEMRSEFTDLVKSFSSMLTSKPDV